jgi:hypothetical protein
MGRLRRAALRPLLVGAGGGRIGLALLLLVLGPAGRGTAGEAPGGRWEDVREEDLVLLPRVSEDLAHRIVAFTRERGGIERYEDLLELDGVDGELIRMLARRYRLRPAPPVLGVRLWQSARGGEETGVRLRSGMRARARRLPGGLALEARLRLRREPPGRVPASLRRLWVEVRRGRTAAAFGDLRIRAGLGLLWGSLFGGGLVRGAPDVSFRAPEVRAHGSAEGGRRGLALETGAGRLDLLVVASRTGEGPEGGSGGNGSLWGAASYRRGPLAAYAGFGRGPFEGALCSPSAGVAWTGAGERALLEILLVRPVPGGGRARASWISQLEARDGSRRAGTVLFSHPSGAGTAYARAPLDPGPPSRARSGLLLYAVRSRPRIWADLLLVRREPYPRDPTCETRLELELGLRARGHRPLVRLRTTASRREGVEDLRVPPELRADLEWRLSGADGARLFWKVRLAGRADHVVGARGDRDWGKFFRLAWGWALHASAERSWLLYRPAGAGFFPFLSVRGHGAFAWLGLQLRAGPAELCLRWERAGSEPGSGRLGVEGSLALGPALEPKLQIRGRP